jgi:hypothetical protein
MDIDRLKDAVRQIEGGVNQLRSIGIGYTLDVLFAAHRLVVERFSPFKVGDRVALSKTPKIDKETAWGWLASKHFLVKGAQGIVRTVDLHSNGDLVFGVEFDDETWIDRDGNRRTVDRKHAFSFREGSLSLAASSGVSESAGQMLGAAAKDAAEASEQDRHNPSAWEARKP